DNHKYYVAVYRADKTGSISLSARTVAFGGVMYAAESAGATFTAQGPVFAFSGVQTIAPGENFTVTVTGANTPGFAGNVTYQFSVSSTDFLTLSDKNGNQVTVTAQTGKGGGEYTLSCTVTITSGVFAGTSETISTNVTVRAFIAPVAEAAAIRNLAAGEKFEDLYTLITATPDSLDTAFAFKIKNAVLTPQVGTLQVNGTQYDYTAPALVSKNGASTLIRVTLEVTGGYYKGYEFDVYVTVTLKPTATFIIAAADSFVTPKTTLTFAPQIGDPAEDGYASFTFAATYTLSNALAGTVHGNVFTAGLQAVSTSVTAQIRILSGTFAGATYTVTATQVVTVTAVAGSALDVAPGQEIDLGAAYTVGGSSFGGIVTSDLSALYTIESGKLSVHRDANFTGADKKGTIILRQTVGAYEYYGEYEFTVTHAALPELTILAVTNNGESVTLDEIKTNGVRVYDELTFTLGATSTAFASIPTTDLLHVGVSMNEVVGEATVTDNVITFETQASSAGVTLTFVAYVYGVRVSQSLTFKIEATSSDLFAFTPGGVLSSGGYIDVSVAFTSDADQTAYDGKITEFVNFWVPGLSSVYGTIEKIGVYYNNNLVSEHTIAQNEDQYTFALNSPSAKSVIGTTDLQVNKFTLRLSARASISSTSLTLSPRISFKYRRTVLATQVAGGGSFGVVALAATPMASDITFAYTAAVRSGDSITVTPIVENNAFSIGVIDWGTIPSGLTDKGNNIFSAEAETLTEFTLHPTITVRGSNYTISGLTVSFAFVPAANAVVIKKGAATVSGFITQDEAYALSLAKSVGSTAVTYSADGITANISGASFTPTSVGSATITAAYTVNGILFTETCAVTVIKA
ncbi:MAG: hypothetical protein K2M95_01100, partial [Clostridiales bacterium]|nr:hypothetical protein [Clostridiales bacterium]